MSLEVALYSFQAYLASQKRVAVNTLKAYSADCTQFIEYLEKRRNVVDRDDLTIGDIKVFLAHLKRTLAMSPASMARKISSLKLFFKYMAREYRMENFGEQLIFPKLPRKLPRFLSEKHVLRLFNKSASDKSLKGQRNYVMLHLLYVAGMRVSEMVNLKISQLHFDDCLIVISGKGGKERVVPIPQPTVRLLTNYIDAIRPLFLRTKKKSFSSDLLFPVIYRRNAKPITRQYFWAIVKRLDPDGSTLSPHIFRHSLATHLLHKGVDLRSLQMLLGHEHLSTVEIYTHVDTSYLRGEYDAKHPRS